MRKKPPKPPAQPAESEPAAERPSGAGPAVPPAARKEYRFEIQEKQGTVAIVGPRGVLAYPKFWIGVELAQGEVFTSCQTGLSAGDGAWVSEVANGRLLLGLSLKRSVTPAGVLLQASVRNNGPEPLEIRQLRVAHAVTGADVTPWGPSAEWSLLRMGYATGGAHREDADTRNSSRVAFNGERVVTRSWGAAALRFGASPRGLVAGFVTAEYRMELLAAVAHHGPLARTELSIVTLKSLSSSTFASGIRQLVADRLVIDRRGDGLIATTRGHKQGFDLPAPPLGPSLYEAWLQKLDGYDSRTFAALATGPKSGVTRAELSKRTGHSLTSSTFAGSIRSLKGQGLCEETGRLVRVRDKTRRLMGI